MIPDRHAEIARRAYTMWELEGRPAGRDLEHWLRAEAEFETTRHVQSQATQRVQMGKEGAPKPRRPTAKRTRRSPHSNAND
jgi:hypothetical protein